MKFIGVGISFGVEMGALTYLGWWADARLGTLPWLTLVGGILGLVVATYSLVRLAERIEAKKDDSGS